MAANLTAQVRNIAKVDDRGRERRPVAEDHRRRQGRDARAEEHHQHDGRSAQLASPPRSRASRKEVGTEGKLGGQAEVQGRRAAPGRTSPTTSTSWPRNLTAQVRNIAKVVTAVANGDLSQKITVDAKGEIARARRTPSTRMVDQLRPFAAEVTRVAQEVGTEGKLGGQADVQGRRRAPGRTSPTTSTSWPSNLTDAGARHRQGRHRGRQRRPVAEARRRGQGRDRRARRHDQQHDQARSASSPSRSRAWRARRRRGQARRAGRGARRRRHLEGPDRQRQPAGEQPDRAGAQHRRGHDRGRERRPVEEDHRRRQGRDPRAQEHHQHDGRSAALLRRARSRASRRRSAPRASSAARPTSRASPAPGRT